MPKTKTPKKRQLKAGTRSVGAAMVLGGVVALSVSSMAAASPGNADNVTFCHRTDSATNPYVVVTTDPEAIIREGHDTHEGPVFSPELKDAHTKWGDIIPAFSFVNGRGETQDYPGMNLPEGQSILDHGCAVPASTTTTVPTTTTSTTTSTTTAPTTSTTTSSTTSSTTSTTTTTAPTTSTTTVPTGVVTSSTSPGGPGQGTTPPGQGGAGGGGAPGAGPALGASPQLVGQAGDAGQAGNQGELAFTGPANKMLGLVGLLLLLVGGGLLAVRTTLVRRPAPSHR